MGVEYRVGDAFLVLGLSDRIGDVLDLLQENPELLQGYHMIKL